MSLITYQNAINANNESYAAHHQINNNRWGFFIHIYRSSRVFYIILRPKNFHYILYSYKHINTELKLSTTMTQKKKYQNLNKDSIYSILIALKKSLDNTCFNILIDPLMISSSCIFITIDILQVIGNLPLNCVRISKVACRTISLYSISLIKVFTRSH